MEYSEVVKVKYKKYELSKKKDNTNSEKKYLKKLRIYPTFLYCYLDKWLQKMSLKGWHIIHCNLLFFWFESGLPEKREYFTYGLSTQEGFYSITLRHPFLEKNMD